MKKNTIQKITSNRNYMGLFIIGLLILSLLFSLILKGKKGGSAPIKEGQIQIVKGDEVITINQNGLVEYRSKDRSYTETWDASQISSFFSMMEQKARDYMSKRTSGGDCGYKVFMFIDNKLVTICIDSNDEDVAGAVEPIVNLTDYFGDDNTNVTPTGEEFNGEVIFPTSTPGISPTAPTPTPYSIYNPNTNYAPVEAGCDAWSADIVRNRAIISNTYCTVISTPTPTP
jgi:hypothetical protein